MKGLIVSLYLATVVPLSTGFAATLEDELVVILTETPADELVHINLIMADKVDPAEMEAALKGQPSDVRREYIIPLLKAKAEETQADLRPRLDEAVTEGLAEDVRYIWLNNSVGLFAKPTLIVDLGEREDIESVNYDPPSVELFRPDNGGDRRGLAWGVERIGADDAWNAGYTGAGVIVAVLDTGCDYEHPDLIGQRWENAAEVSGTPDFDDDGNGYVDDFYGWNFYEDNNDVHDTSIWFNEHGTHVTGIIAGDGTNGTQTGVAPDAKFMTAITNGGNKPKAFEADVWEGMQYAFDNVAHIINLSNGCYHWQNPNRAAWRAAFENLAVGGMISIVSVGNRGEPGFPDPPDEVATPADVPCVIAVGATNQLDSRWVIPSDGSSRGPTTWFTVAPYNDYPYPPGLIKPDLCAPGADITSTRGDGEEPHYGYRLSSGTSMAAPHVAGLAALILDAVPGLTQTEVCWSMVETATDLGQPGKDNEYGWGLIQCLPAINYALTGQIPSLA